MRKLRNRACFEKKLIKYLEEIISYACSFLKYWAGLQKEEDGDEMIKGANILQATALASHKGSITYVFNSQD
jgi:hypothetical protein